MEGGASAPYPNLEPHCGHGDMWQRNKLKLDPIEQFYEAHKDAEGNLSDADNARMLMLDVQGDTGAVVLPEGGTPDATLITPAAATPAAPAVPDPIAAPAVAPAAATGAPAELTPVVLAKDGVHTIPFEKLSEAREAAKRWETVAQQTRAELDALKTAPAPAPAPAPVVAAAPAAPAGDAAATPADVFGDYSEEAIAKGVATLVDAKVKVITEALEAKFTSALAPVQQKAVIDANAAHYSAIYTAHPDADSVVESAEMKAYIDSQPTFMRAAMQDVLEKGTAHQVVELLDTYRKAHPPAAAAAVAPAAAPAAAPVEAAADAAAKARALVTAAKSATPTSLSDLPAGSAAHHDEAAAILEMSDAAIAEKFAAKSPEQIRDLMSRLL